MCAAPASTAPPSLTSALAVFLAGPTDCGLVTVTKRLGFWRALWLACLLALAWWAPTCQAAGSRLVERAFVLDPTGTMTLEQALAQPPTPFAKYFDNSSNMSTAW